MLRPALCLLTLMACAPDRAEPSPEVGTSTASPTAATTEPGLRYTPDQAGIVALFDDACVSCHAPGESAESLPLAAAVEADLASGAGGLVVPGDPAASRLWRVLVGELDASDFDIMPQSGLLAEEYVGHVSLWIQASAPWALPPADADQDGFAVGDDCDDADAAIFPGADEVCDGADNDCDGATDPAESLDAGTWFPDADADGYGEDALAVTACESPVGHVALGGDCDDADDLYHPGADESDCTDPADYNCDGASGRDDNDGDGFAACRECDDASDLAYPGADEVCDGDDDDCDGQVDEAAAVDATVWYADVDLDGFGDPATATRACDAPAGSIAMGADCDDGDALINPDAASDPTNGVDDDCDGQIDEDNVSYTHTVDIQPLWDAECVTCHGGFVPSGGLSLEADAWFAIVSVPSDDVPSMDLVAPGDPANSYLWAKLIGDQAAVGGLGSDMPKAGPLGQADLDMVETWILEGAAH